MPYVYLSQLTQLVSGLRDKVMLVNCVKCRVPTPFVFAACKAKPRYLRWLCLNVAEAISKHTGVDEGVAPDASSWTDVLTSLHDCTVWLYLDGHAGSRQRRTDGCAQLVVSVPR
jgi:hypothetical protein